MAELEKITKQEANKLVLKDIKNSLICAGLMQSFTIGGVITITHDHKIIPPLAAIVMGVMTTGIGLYLTIDKLKSIYHTAREYISDPVAYIENTHNKELI